MKITFIANACAIVEHDGFSVLSDPWIIDGAFDGAWCHCPPLRATPENLPHYDAVYISHLHPDHYDIRFVRNLRRDIPIIILDHEPNFLRRMLIASGFTNLIAIKDRETRTVGSFQCTMYAPFVKAKFYDASIGNLIDSALCLRAGGESILNTNDNTPSVEISKQLAAENITLALLNYNTAGPYPACFDNLSHAEKLAERDRILQRNLEHFARVAQLMRPRYVIPFAGSYVLGGREWQKNQYLAATSTREAARYLQQSCEQHSITGIKAISLCEGQNLDLQTGIVTGQSFEYKAEQAKSYIETVLAKRAYDYEQDIIPALDQLVDMLAAARKRLWRAQTRYDFFPSLAFAIRLKADLYFTFNWHKPESALQTTGDLPSPHLICSLDLRLLGRILQRESHWNNAEIGCHINFLRTPNVYMPDVHTLLSTFHV